jgi:iron complex outermembrane receptor protein
MFYQKRKIAVAVAMVTATICSYTNAAEDSPNNATRDTYTGGVHLEDRLVELVVTAPFAATEAQTALPIGILSGEALREKAANSLGDTLKNEIGMSNSSFGTGVGQPIIRGQTGNRVSILQNGIALTDASNVSPDHANGTEALLADRIEVIRGPSTLLYGSGAVGGVVNVIDNRIPSTLVEQPNFQLEQSHNGVNNENKTVMRLDASVGSFGFHLDAFTRENDNYEINGFAIDEEAAEAVKELGEALLAGGEEHDEVHEEEEFENSRGFINNSDGEGKGGTAGFSYVTDAGFFGFSVSELENKYGLPPGSHGGHGEEEEEGEEHEEGDEEHEEEVEFVRINMEQTRYDFKGQMNFENSWIESFKANVGFTDYEHREIEIFEDGDSEVGTLFSNKGTEARFELKRAPTGDWSGVYGVQLSNSEFSAIGEEAFIPRSDINNIGLFGVERYQRNRLTAEIGFRLESNEIDPSGACDNSENASSVSGSLLYDIDDQSNILLSAAHSERPPSVEELFSNIALDTCGRIADEESLVPHAATGLMEIGNSSLDSEVSNNFEFGYRRHSGRFTGEFSAYRNEIEDYIFLNITGEEVDETPVAGYIAQDATFTGLEAEVSVSLLSSDSLNAEFSLFGDVVNAEFDAGGNVPRIPPAKVGAELRYFGNNWSAHVHATRVLSQTDQGPLELETDAYTLLSLYADYHVQVAGDSEFKLFARGDNLLDEEIRNHASFLRNYAPEAGRGITLGVRFEY